MVLAAEFFKYIEITIQLESLNQAPQFMDKIHRLWKRMFDRVQFDENAAQVTNLSERTKFVENRKRQGAAGNIFLSAMDTFSAAIVLGSPFQPKMQANQLNQFF